MRTPSPKRRRRVTQPPHEVDPTNSTPPRLGRRRSKVDQSTTACDRDTASTLMLKKESAIGELVRISEVSDQAMTAWVAGPGRMAVSKGVAALYDQVLSHMQPQPWLCNAFGSGPHNALVSAGDYHILLPELADVPRLRELEREFVRDHCGIFSKEHWHAKVMPVDWCGLLSVDHGEQAAIRALGLLVLGHLPGHLTLKCVHAPRGREPPRVVGFTHIITKSGVEIAHLFVEGRSRGRGLGALLIAGIPRAMERLSVVAQELHLNVITGNTRAVSFYRGLGFSAVHSARKPVGTVASIEWQIMTKKLNASHAQPLCARGGGG